jgi:hypothetical protein
MAIGSWPMIYVMKRSRFTSSKVIEHKVPLAIAIHVGADDFPNLIE